MIPSILRKCLLLPLLLATSAFGGFPAAAHDDPACTPEDRIYMARAYELARYAITHGGGPFGALLVKDGKVLAEYSNSVHATGDITKHAETGLISAFSPKIDRETFAKSTLYTSTEPCAMCCGAICFAAADRNPLTSHEILGRIAPAVKVLGPLMEAEGLTIHESYWPVHPEDVGKS